MDFVIELNGETKMIPLPIEAVDFDGDCKDCEHRYYCHPRTRDDVSFSIGLNVDRLKATMETQGCPEKSIGLAQDIIEVLK